MNYEKYYNGLSKPFFAPPSNVFGIVWPFLYILIIASFGWVLYQILIKKRWDIKLFVPFGINLIANALYSPLFFNWQKPFLATIDIFIVLTSIIAIILLMKSRAKRVMVAQVPYLIWVSFATVLQVSILIKNWN